MTTPEMTPDASAHKIVHELMAIKPHESVAIMCDEDSPPEMVAALQKTVRDLGAEFAVMVQPSRTAQNKNLMNPMIEHGLERADVLIGLTKSSGAPVYAAKVKALLQEKRLRVMSLAMRDLDTLTRGGAVADYASVKAEGDRLAEIWRKSRNMRITSAAGTDITAPIAFDDVIVECGFVHEAGYMAGLPDGEVSSRPIEGTANGLFVVDGPAAIIGTSTSPIKILVESGRVVAVEGDGPEADELRHILKTVENADNIAEFGIGLNPLSRPDGIFQEVKKSRGQVHIALGDNLYYGGKTESLVHIDMVVINPTVQLDDTLVVEQGQPCF
ncbi:MAG: aminopeptidase [Pseudomonadota bacterium]